MGDKRNKSEFAEFEPKKITGTHWGGKRDSEDSYINADQYADALMEHFLQTKDDFCFGLLGPWGEVRHI